MFEAKNHLFTGLKSLWTLGLYNPYCALRIFLLSMRVGDLALKIDRVLAFAVVHEVGDAARFFSEVQSVLKPRGRVLLAEPRGHVSKRAFEETLCVAAHNGLQKIDSLQIARSHAAILERV